MVGLVKAKKTAPFIAPLTSDLIGSLCSLCPRITIILETRKFQESLQMTLLATVLVVITRIKAPANRPVKWVGAEQIDLWRGAKAAAAVGVVW